jgi:hypothetical protein
MARTVRFFIPPIAKAIEKRSQTPEGLLAVLEFLGTRRFDRFLDDPRVFAHDQVAEEGSRVLSFLFRKQERIDKIVDNRAKVLPIEPAMLHRLFPVIALIVLGAISVRTRRPLGVILHRLSQGELDDRSISNPYLALAQHLRKGESAEKEHRRRRLFTFFGVGSSTEKPAAADGPKLMTA